jgi:hypothetical protein
MPESLEEFQDRERREADYEDRQSRFREYIWPEIINMTNASTEKGIAQPAFVSRMEEDNEPDESV